jgi:hypothetical protein
MTTSNFQSGSIKSMQKSRACGACRVRWVGVLSGVLALCTPGPELARAQSPSSNKVAAPANAPTGAPANTPAQASGAPKPAVHQGSPQLAYSAEDYLQLFREVKEHFLQREVEAAAEDVQSAALLMTSDSRWTHASAAAKVQASIKELENLALMLRAKKIWSPYGMDDVFARAHWSMALDHFARSDEAKKNKQWNRAGRDLREAAMHVEGGWLRTGLTIDYVTTKLLQDMFELAGQMSRGIAPTRDDAPKVLELFRKEIDRLGTKAKLNRQK